MMLTISAGHFANFFDEDVGEAILKALPLDCAAQLNTSSAQPILPLRTQ
jgi:hypothetical protein